MEANTPPENARDGTPAPVPSRGIAFQLAALLLTLISAVAATGLARWLRQPPPTPPAAEKPPAAFPGKVFKGWEKPDLVIAVTGQQMGYLEPCGCSEPQIGGLVRRHNLFQMMRDRGWPVVPVDIGDLPQRTGPAGLPNQQGLIKYRFAMSAMKEMGYLGVGIGGIEAGLGLFSVLAEYPLQFPSPRVVAGNLMDPEKNYPDMTKPWNYVDVKPAGVRVGVTAVVGPLVAERIKQLARDVRFGETVPSLDHVTAQMKKGGVTLPILLYQGPLTRDPKGKAATEAKACAEAYPQFPIVACLSDEDEPSFRPTFVENKAGGKTMIVSAGRRGKYVVAIGVWKTGKADRPFDLKYERVEMSPDFKTPPAEEKGHAVMRLMEAYTQELKKDNYLEKYGQVRHALQVLPEVKGLRNPGKPEYVGSEACRKCHEHAYDIWLKTPHSHAYNTLVTSTKKPSNRQYDPECIVCHTVGFGYETGFRTEKSLPNWIEAKIKAGGKVNPRDTKHGLRDVGCESCHGPSSLHVRNPDNKEWRKRINPWAYLPKEKREDAMDQFCQKCHDHDNDVTWLDKGDGKGGGFKRKWPKIIHMTPVPSGDD